ncbi:MAG: putative Peptidase zinc-dependent [Promethearchaeota archaeon]|nr:MAG: putative Peptidase zinc-dependent [Candidatus Lokiarchaeota archaeon]
MELQVVIEEGVKEFNLKDFRGFILTVFPFIREIQTTHGIILCKQCWIAKRNQYNAECLLDYVLRLKDNNIVAFFISQDTYIRDLNYVFGIGASNIGAVISTYRFKNDISNFQKVVLHELGHIFGLDHCLPPCPMASSNNILDLYPLNGSYCQSCQKELRAFEFK